MHADIFTRLVELARLTPEIEVLWLYGSHAKGTAHEQSDIDLAIKVPYTLAMPELFAEELALEWQSALQLSEHRLSVVAINRAPAALAFNIIEYGKVLLCTNQYEYMQIVPRIYSKYEFAEIEVLHDR